MNLSKREQRFSEKAIRAGLLHPMARAFHKPQRDHAPKVQHPKPERSA